MLNTWLLIGALVGTVAVSVHVFTFERLIWPYLGYECFPSTVFGGPKATRNFYRVVWHFFTVNWLLTIIVCLLVGIGTLVPYGMLLIYFLLFFWILILVEIAFIGALVLEPGESYIKTSLRQFQWVFVLLVVICMYLGTRYQV